MYISTEEWVTRRLSGQNVTGFEPDTRTTMPGLPLVDAVEAHLAWVGRLTDAFRNHRDDELDENALGVDNMCILGKWIYSEEPTLGRYPEYELLRETHAQFHLLVKRIISDHKRGYMLESIKALDHDLPKRSREVCLKIAALASAA